tara:strand:- start:1249 stop:1545 length:297 start_codon:yes stop_codon:yes gene_type:complete
VVLCQFAPESLDGTSPLFRGVDIVSRESHSKRKAVVAAPVCEHELTEPTRGSSRETADIAPLDVLQMVRLFSVINLSTLHAEPVRMDGYQVRGIGALC